MNLNLAPEIHRNNSAERKFFRKMLTYLSDGGNDPGERHEINTVYQALKNSIKINGITYQAPDGSYFSVDKFAKWDKITNHQLKSKLDNALALGTASKVFAGMHHEVDLVVQAGADRVVIECKSGGAHSSGAQLSSYVELLLTMANPAIPTRHYFAHCYDSDGDASQEDVMRLIHKFLCIIPKLSVTPASPPMFGPAQAYLALVGYSQSENAKPVEEISKIFEYEAAANLTAPIPAGIGGPLAVGLLNTWPKQEEYVTKANEILLRRLGFGLTIFHVSKTTDERIKQWLDQYADVLAGQEKAVDLKLAAAELLGY